MRILGLETSCDETAAAVVERKNGRFRLLSSAVASSEEIHKKYGGIIPEQAAREQIRVILPVIQEALYSSKLTSNNPRKRLFSTDCHVPRLNRGPRNDKETIQYIDAIAVTVGPGLIGSLIIGVETAKTLSFMLGKPIIPVNHLLAHLYVNFLDKRSCHSGAECNGAIESYPDGILSPLDYARGSRMTVKDFPAIGLIVSGGHTDLLLFKSLGSYKWIGGTRDDAAGECLDKAARLLGLGYPGGPEIELAASKSKDQRAESKNTRENLKLPRPMMNEDNFDFSFSGLKTAVLRKLQATPLRTSLPACRQGYTGQASSKQQEFVKWMAWEIQEAVTDVLVEKTVKAVEKYQVKSILAGGGVIANARLRRKLQVTSYKLQVKLFMPEKKFCTDNAVGIAIGGFLGKKIPWKNLRPEPGLEL